jgi:hypothetical protein
MLLTNSPWPFDAGNWRNNFDADITTIVFSTAGCERAVEHANRQLTKEGGAQVACHHAGLGWCGSAGLKVSLMWLQGSRAVLAGFVHTHVCGLCVYGGAGGGRLGVRG